MIRITRMTDYAIVLLAHMASDSGLLTHNAPDLAAKTNLPLPTVSKLLKQLARKGLLVTQRGIKGGFRLTRRPEAISVAEIIDALEGPIAITECSTEAPGRCQLERLCPVSSNWQKINRAVRVALDNISLAEMTQSLPHGFPLLGYERKKAAVELQPR